MQYPERSVSIWFGRESSTNAEYLQAWRQSPLSYNPNSDTDENWNADRYEISLGRDNTGELFHEAARLILINQFYPPEVMSVCSDYTLQKRPIQVGDRVLQRIRILQIFNKPVLDILTLNVITEVIQEPRRVGFTYTTTVTHSEIGEWSPVIEWQENGDVVLIISVFSRVHPDISLFWRRFARKMQLRAHQLSISNYLGLLNNNSKPADAARFSADLLPVSLLATAVFLLVAALLGVNRRSR